MADMLLFLGKAAFFGVFQGFKSKGRSRRETCLQNMLAYPCR